MNSVHGNNLASSCIGKGCETDQCPCHAAEQHPGVQRCCPQTRQCQSIAENLVLVHSPRDDHESPRNPYSSNQEGERGELKEKHTSLGFEPDENGVGVCGFIVSEKENRPVYYGEVTPEQPEKRTKGTPAGQEFRHSPLVGHTDAIRCGYSADDRYMRLYGPGDETGSSHFPSPFQSQHHHQGNTCPSDTYLRQALTSPYNQRGEKHGVSSAHTADNRSGSKETSLLYSPSLTTFKTPLKSVRSPDRVLQERAISGSSSPLSSALGGSSSSRHGLSHNPFELHHDRLHFPVFSPNMFSISQSPGSAEKETFQWNIEHLAELRPVHIDDKDIQRQLSKQWHDEEAEKRAQKAIDYYFQHHMVAPSPWSEVPPPHVLPVTPCGPGYDDLMATTPNQAQGSIQKDLPRSKRAQDKSCQTTLTLPLNLDLEKILGEYMTYQDTERDESIGMSSSSLRRKLFFSADCSTIVSPVKSGQKSPDRVSAALNTPPNSKSTPQWDRGSPLHTPSSVQFSSSPIRGPLKVEGDYYRSPWEEHGPLASPELSPIANRRGGRFRQSLGFSSIHGGMEDEAGLGFGSPIRKQLQMEVHDGSPVRERPSPDVSPIAAFGSDGSGHQSRSRTLRADMSQSLLTSPQHHHHHHPAFSPSPDPASSMPVQRATSQRVSVSMDTDCAADFFPSVEKETGIVSPHDTSLTEMTLGEGGTSGLDTDTLQHPSSASYPDTGYQTGSGNGSLQTTQEGAVSLTTNTSTDAPSNMADTGTQLKKLAAKLQSGAGEQSVGLRVPVEEVKPGPAARLPPDESSVDGMGTSVDIGQVAHSNLTSQFMSLPVHAELSCNSADFNSSLQILTQMSEQSPLSEDLFRVPAERTLSKDMPVDSSRSKQFFLSMEGSVDPSHAAHVAKGAQLPTSNINKQLTAQSMKGLVSVNPTDTAQVQNVKAKGAEHPLTTPPSSSEGDFSEEDDQGLALNSYIYRHDADFLIKLGDYLENGGELSDDGIDRGKVVPPPLPQPPPPSRKHRGAGCDDSVLERAHQYLASVNYSEDLDKETSMETGTSLPTIDHTSSAKPAGLSTPTKRLLGRVADDLTAGREKPDSPALASDVAQELIRRAEQDLKRLRQTCQKKGTS